MSIFLRWLTVSLALLAAPLSTPSAFADGLFAYAAGGPESFPFAVSPALDSGILALDLGMFGASALVDRSRPAPSRSELNPASIPGFDRVYYTTTPSSWMSYASDGTVAAVMALPAVLLLGMSARQVLTVGAMYLETMGFSFSAKDLLKAAVVRYRPYAYSPDADVSGFEADSSFPSGHSTVAFGAAVFAGYLAEELYPQSGSLQAFVWVTGLGLATLTMALRVGSGNHFLTDVVAGGLIGALGGFLIPYLHREDPPGGESAGSAPLVSFTFAP